MRSEPSEAAWAALNNKGHVEPLQYKFYCGEESGKDRTVKHQRIRGGKKEYGYNKKPSNLK